MVFEWVVGYLRGENGECICRLGVDKLGRPARNRPTRDWKRTNGRAEPVRAVGQGEGNGFCWVSMDGGGVWIAPLQTEPEPKLLEFSPTATWAHLTRNTPAAHLISLTQIFSTPYLISLTLLMRRCFYCSSLSLSLILSSFLHHLFSIYAVFIYCLWAHPLVVVVVMSSRSRTLVFAVKIKRNFQIFIRRLWICWLFWIYFCILLNWH